MNQLLQSLATLKTNLIPILILFGVSINIYSGYVHSGQAQEFIIESGTVTGRIFNCYPGAPCEPVITPLKGSVIARLNDSEIVYVDTALEGFEEEGSFDLHMYYFAAEIQHNFDFDGETLVATGYVDESPYDGPRFDYEFTARLVGDADFDAEGYYLATWGEVGCGATPRSCRGVTLEKANKRYMKCPSGEWAKQCYVASVVWPGFYPFSFYPSSTLLLKGEIRFSTSGSSYFVTENAYRPATTNIPEQKLVALENTRKQCVKAPCANIQEFLLNSTYQRAIAGYDLNPAGATVIDQALAIKAINSGAQIFAAGQSEREWSLTGSRTIFYVNQFYLEIIPQ